MSPPPVRRARDVAELRTWLVEELAPTGRLGYALHIVEDVAHRQHHNAPTSRSAEARAMAEADLWYVPADAMSVLEEASRSVPDDVRLDMWQMPSVCGFCVFEEPLYGTDANAGTPIRVDALLWGPVSIFDDDEHRPVKAIGISCWHHRDEHSPVLQWAAMTDSDVFKSRDYWTPLGRSDWEIGTAVSHLPPVYIRSGEEMMKSAIEDRALIAALWGMALAAPQNQVEFPARSMRKRAERAGISAKPGVRVLTFPKSIASSEPGDPTGRHLSVRFMVRGHWRRQACGPGRQQHRHVYIAPHWRGPEGAPLSHPATVVKQLRG